MVKVKQIKQKIIYGHPQQFWKLRQQKDNENLICPEDLKKAFDVMEYDSVHLQKASGKYYTKADEWKLRESQKLQMLEKKNIEREEKVTNMMWHEMLLQEVKMKKEREDYDAEISRQEMKQRRQAYDEQIASANRQRREIIEIERESEKKRLMKMKEKMEQEYYFALKRKKKQALENKKNFLEGHEMKMNRLKHEKDHEINVDLKRIEVSNEELRTERKNKLEKIVQLQNEKQIFVDNTKIEKNMLKILEKETETVLANWKRDEDNKILKQSMRLDEEKLKNKQEKLAEYRRYIDAKNRELEKKRKHRIEEMEAVRRRALQDLQKNMSSANEELKKQLDYRQKLTRQIYENQKVLESETNEHEQKQLPFTRKAITFKDAMLNKLNYSTQRISPVHPFTRMVPTDGENCNTKLLPTLKEIYYNSNHEP